MSTNSLTQTDSMNRIGNDTLAFVAGTGIEGLSKLARRELARREKPSITTGKKKPSHYRSVKSFEERKAEALEKYHAKALEAIDAAEWLNLEDAA